MAWRPFAIVHGLPIGAFIGVITSAAAKFFSLWLFIKLRKHPEFIFLPSAKHITGTEAGLIVVGDAPHIGIPQLQLYPPNFRDLVDISSGFVKTISFPPLDDGHIVMAYCWNMLLQSGVQWLAEKARIAEHDCSTAVKSEAEQRCTLSASFLQSSTLPELVSKWVQTVFLTPLLDLIEQWKQQELTHPVSHLLSPSCYTN